MANIFDQFDEEEEVAPAAPTSSGNIFDQFDEAPAQAPISPEVEAQTEQKQAVLPLPKETMFYDMADADAKDVYSAYARHPHTQIDENGDLVYRGQIVPRPEGNTGLVDAVTEGVASLSPGRIAKRMFGENPDVDQFDVMGNLVEGAVGGVIKGAKAVGTGLTAAGEWAGVLPEGSFETVEETLPDFNPEGTAQSIGSTVGQIGGGIVAGNKIQALATGLKAVQAVAGSQAVAAMSQTLPKAVSYIANIASKNIGASIGAAGSLPGQSDKIVAGPEALVPTGVGFDEQADSAAQEELEGRLNLFIDSMLIAFPVEMAADFGKGAVNIVYEGWLKPLVGVANESVQEKVVMTGIFNRIENAMGLKTPEQKNIVRQKIVEILKHPENREVLFKIGKEGVDDVNFQLDVATIIERGLADDPSEAAAILRSSMKGQRKGVTEMMPTGRTALAIERPERALDTVLSQSETAFGGDEAIQESANRFQGVGRARVDDAQAKAADIETSLTRAQESLPDIIRKDGPLGEALGRTADESGSATFQLRNEAGGDIIKTVDTGTDIVRDQKNQLWADLPEDLPFDEESFGAAVEEALPFLPNKLKAQIEGVTDFKSLQNLRNSLGNEISRLRARNDLGVAELQNLRKNIAEVQPAYLKQIAGDNPELISILDELGEGADEVTSMIREGADALDDATTYQKDVYGKVQKGAIKEIDQTRKAFGFDDVGRDEKAREILHKTLTSEHPSKVKHLIETVARPEFAGNADRVGDYILADVADKLRTKVKSSGLGELNVDDVLKTLQSSRQALANFPDVAKRLDDFENNLIQARGDIKGIEKVLATQKQAVKDVEIEVYEGVLKDFFEKNGAIKGSGFQSFQDLFRDTHSLERLKELTNLAKDDPVVLDGMKAAYSKVLDNKIFNYTPTTTRPKSLSSTKGAEAVKGIDPILDYGRVLFEDQPIMMEAIDDLMRLSLDMNAAKKMKSEGASINQALRDAVAARNRLVLFFVGPLTRIGARIGAVSSTILEKLDPNQTVAMIKDKIFADPDEFVRIAEGLFKDGQPAENARNAFTFLLRAGLYDESDYNAYEEAVRELDTESQTEEAFAE